MRTDKQYICEAIEGYLGQSTYFFLTNFERITVAEIAELRANLSKAGAQFHVVKNNLLDIVTRKQQLPEMSNYLKGPSALVFGGEAPSEVAKILAQFQKDKEKANFKVGVLDKKLLIADDIVALSKLPSLDVLRGQLLGLLTTPMRQLLYVMQGVPQGLLNVLQAHAAKA